MATWRKIPRGPTLADPADVLNLFRTGCCMDCGIINDTLHLYVQDEWRQKRTCCDNCAIERGLVW